MRAGGAVTAILAVVVLVASWPLTRPQTEFEAASLIPPTAVAAAEPEPTPTPSPTPSPTPPPIDAAVVELQAALAAGRADDAVTIFDQHPAVIDDFGRDRLDGLNQALAEAFVPAIRQLDTLVVDDDLARAAELADRLVARYPDDPDIVRRHGAVATWLDQTETGVAWVGEVPHLFIHSLIIRTELAFDGDYQDLGYRTYMITRHEFEQMLAQMYADDWILVGIHDLIEIDDDGQVSPAELMVPPGKKPFVFSIDDVSYYDYMAGNGFAERLELDARANVATVVLDDDGTETLTLDGDAMPILDQFVLDHPDFSLGGVKGILAVTGYEGVFGYDFSRDQTDEPDFEQRREDAARIAARLRELGWVFASHSYTHGDWLKNPLSSWGRFTFDGDNWAAEIEPVLGGSDVYISPFGYHLSPNNPRYRYLVEELGFKVFSPISDGVTTVFHDDSVVMHRIAVDGFMLTDGAARLEPYFDPAEVIDPDR